MRNVDGVWILEENDISSFDVDGTLVIWPKDYHNPAPGRLKFQYGDETIYLYPHVPHITFLKYCFKRGDWIKIWSKNKYAWANHVCEVLGIKGYINQIESKTSRHIDDKTAIHEIVGEHIFMKYDPEEVYYKSYAQRLAEDWDKK